MSIPKQQENLPLYFVMHFVPIVVLARKATTITIFKIVLSLYKEETSFLSVSLDSAYTLNQ